MKLKNGHTSKTAAAAIALKWMKAAYDGKTDDIAALAGTSPAAQRELRRQVAELHNIILECSGMDGKELGKINTYLLSELLP